MPNSEDLVAAGELLLNYATPVEIKAILRAAGAPETVIARIKEVDDVLEWLTPERRAQFQIGPDNVGGGIEPAALRVNDDAVIYGIDLKLIVGDPSHYAAINVGAGRIFLRNVDTGGGIIQGAERMPNEVNIA